MAPADPPAVDCRMAKSNMAFEFVAPVLRLETGLRQHYVPIPDDVAGALKSAGTRRVLATINGYTVSRGIQGIRDGERILMLGRPILREAGVDYGDMVDVRIMPDPEPDTIELCAEFEAVLAQDPAASERFQSLTSGQRRGLAYYVNGAKRESTRISRALATADRLRTYRLYGDR